MMTKNWFVIGAMGALLVAYGVGCGGGGGSGGAAGSKGSAGSTGAGGDFGQGQAGDNGGQAGDNGGAAGMAGGAAGMAGGTTGTAGRTGNRDGGFTFDAAGFGGRTGRDGGVRDGGGFAGRAGRDAGVRDGGFTFDAGTLPACAAGVMNGGACTRGTSVTCKPAMGTLCTCNRQNVWVCF